ncbi:hypothetical protein ANCCAN_21189 [Ancylostoma caninum]|uniref:Uncharacterized protein n=1 Tax=Ancylostoma caninum TaxID=29170 RepID=A0A368FLE6_ANCCA|nr:hypothetical protein ANCCAN_21189 [Ancylostoma caninum]
MQLQDYPQQPSDFRVPMIARQSGGRLLPLTVIATRSISGVLNSIIKENALLYDDGFKDCSAAQQVSFFVESTASRVILDITGNDVATPGAVSVLDGAGKAVPVNTRNALMNDAAALVIDFAMLSSGPAGGKWTVNIKTTSGSCFIQVRVMVSFFSMHWKKNFQRETHAYRGLPGFQMNMSRRLNSGGYIYDIY